MRSHPARGAWIEISATDAAALATLSRTPQGVRGLKYLYADAVNRFCGRTPQGVRGLKYRRADHGRGRSASHPARGAWIEIRARR